MECFDLIAVATAAAEVIELFALENF